MTWLSVICLAAALVAAYYLGYLPGTTLYWRRWMRDYYQAVLGCRSCQSLQAIMTTYNTDAFVQYLDQHGAELYREFPLEPFKLKLQQLACVDEFGQRVE